MMSAREYRPSLDKLLRLCERNYGRLCALLSQARERQGRRRHYLWRHRDEPLQLEIVILEQTPYTERLKVRRLAPPLPFVNAPELELRLYHDARVAEVLSGQQFLRLLPRYPYPNRRMLQRDEKFQVNLFLAELLEQFAQHEWQLVSLSEEKGRS
ncbi:DUF1249 domain-containing protein [Ferrimonas gelatinilytica]|uniref:DUF1249 domain-containing protein n=1 Tax=Ferrimonas gelatinilytica TaxID=1255257 RepID=A0ABP9S896_9GAMM